MATFQEMWPDWEIGVKRMPGDDLLSVSCEGSIIVDVMDL